MKKKLAATLLAGALSACMILPAFATITTVPDTGTEVWAGVIIEDKNPIVKVEVPTLFAFVVNGTTGTGDSSAVTSKNGYIYLPNVKVDKNYSLHYTGDGEMKMNNFSTYLEKDQTESIRKGLKLTINGEIKESSEKNGWEYSNTIVEADPGNESEFKKYQISIDTKGLTDVTPDGYKMKDDIELEAPDTRYSNGSYGNLDQSTNLAIKPTTHIAAFDVIVGGRRDQYNKSEQSAKIGNIIWTVSADVSASGP